MSCECENKLNCEQQTTVDYIPNTAATFGVTTNGVTDTLDMTDAIHNVEAKTRIMINDITGTLDYWNEDYMVTEEEGYIQRIQVPDILKYGSLENLGNVQDTQPKNGDLLYYKGDATCGPNCYGIHDSWIKLHAPTEDGKYNLTMTVEDGVPTLSWEKEN